MDFSRFFLGTKLNYILNKALSGFQYRASVMTQYDNAYMPSSAIECTTEAAWSRIFYKMS